MQVWAIIDEESDPGLTPGKYILFSFVSCMPVLQVFDIRHEDYAKDCLERWKGNSHPNAELVLLDIGTNLPNWQQDNHEAGT